jgi:hypothetical protein
VKVHSGLDLGTVFSFCEHGNNHLYVCFFLIIRFLDHATNRQFLKDDCEMWS